MSYETTQIVLSNGMADKLEPRVAPNGALEIAKNVSHDKNGTFNKRRGFRIILNADAVFGNAEAETHHHAVSGLDGTLLVFGYDHATAVVSRDATADGGDASFVYRSYVPRGLVWRQDVTGSGGGEDVGAG